MSRKSALYSKIFFDNLLEEKYQKSINFRCLQEIKLPANGSVYINYYPYSGGTAFGLTSTELFLEEEKVVIYIDSNNSILSSRIKNFPNVDNLVVLKPYEKTPQELLIFLQEFSEFEEDLIIILDNIDFVVVGWKEKWSLSLLISRISQICPKALTLIIKRERYPIDRYRNITIKKQKNVYFTNELGEHMLLGHLVELKQNMTDRINTGYAFIDYKTGRMSKAWDYAMDKINRGASKTSKFSLDGIEAEGLWKFVYKYTVEKNGRYNEH